MAVPWLQTLKEYGLVMQPWPRDEGDANFPSSARTIRCPGRHHHGRIGARAQAAKYSTTTSQRFSSVPDDARSSFNTTSLARRLQA